MEIGMKRLVRLVLVVLLLAFVAPCWGGDTWRLTILHGNDLHGMMQPFDYQGTYPGLAGKQANVGGMARRATLIKRLRREVKNPMLVVEAGDLFTRGPWHTRWYGVPEIEAMNLMGYDLLCVGNNELKATGDTESQERMRVLVRRSRFPWVSANLTVEGTATADRPAVPVEGVQPFVVRTFGRMRVGLLGLTAPRADAYPQVKGWRVGNPIEAAKRWVPLARKECDILIAVTHMGEKSDRQLAAQVEGIDAIVGGDSHTFLPHPVLVKNPAGVDVPIAQAGELGVVLGRLDLTFEYGNGWRLKAAEGHLLPITAALPEDPEVKRLLESYLDAPAVSALPWPAPAWAFGG
jgi:2',3'-cyclic-nucleotide 2'-phosphodiesterase (5'-nucleotidase family)